MSDFSRTPNYNLYKPAPGADDDAWGDHWNWNADTLDSALHGILSWTSTGSTTSRAAQDRSAEVVNVKDFGAKGDGATDDTAAINGALNHVRAAGITTDHWTFRIIFPAGRYVVSGPLNFTGLHNIATTIVIDGCGSEIWLKSASAVVDCLSSRWLTFQNLAIYGDPVSTPKVGLQIGRVSSLQGDCITLINVKCYGSFSFTGFYNFASEIFAAYSCMLSNNVTAAGAYCIVQDGVNHWHASSTFVTVTAAADTPQSFNDNTFFSCTIQGNGPSGNVWISNANSHAFQRCYTSNVSGSPFILYAYSGGIPLASWLEIGCHCETTGLAHMIQLTGAAGVTYALINGLMLSDYTLQASASVFAIDATSAIANVDIRGGRFRLGGNCPTLFDAPAKYSVRAEEAYLHHGMWAMPAYWSGPVSDIEYPGTVIVPENARVVAANGGSFTMYNNMGWVELVPAASIAAFTAVMPPSAVHGQTVLISTTQTITTLTLTPNTGQTIAVPPGTLTANTSISYRYDGQSAAWLSLGRTAA